MNDFHPLVERFGEVVDNYDARPTYPQRLLELLRDNCGLDEQTRVVDIGAGTGLLTQMVVKETAHVVAVEPVAAMRDELRTTLPMVDVREGSAEALPLADSSVDLALAGNSFHWFNQTTVWPELARVLKPGGFVAIIWISRDRTWGWQQRISEVIEKYSIGTPAGNEDWSRWAPIAATSFGEVSEWHEQFDLVFTKKRLVQMFSSFSFIANLKPELRAAVLHKIESAAPVNPDLRFDAETSSRENTSRNSDDDVFPMKFDLDVYLLTRTSL